MDADGELPSTSTPRRVNLSCLPAAVKTHIARLCAEADRALKRTLTSARQTGRGTLAESIDAFERDRRGSSLRGLYCASREWSSIAAPFRFNSLDVKGFRAPIFQMRILHVHGQHFREVNLLGTTLSDLILLAPLLHFLPNVTKMWVPDLRPGKLRLPDSPKLDQQECAQIETTFKSILTRAEHIVVHVTATDVLPALVPEGARPRLPRLSVILSDPAACSAFFDLLPNMRALTKLSVCFSCDIAALDAALSLALATQASAIRLLPSLRALSVATSDIAPSLFDFMSLFSPTLESIVLVVKGYSLGFRPQNPSGSTSFTGPFPKLVSLGLRGDAAALEGPLGGMTDYNMPLLKSLDYIPDYLPARPERRAGEAPIPTPHRTAPLQDLLICPAVSPDDRTLIEQLPISRVPTDKRELDRDVFQDVLWYCRSTSEAPVDLDDVQETVKDTIDYLCEWRERAKVQRDAASLVKMARALCNVELERIAHEA